MTKQEAIRALNAIRVYCQPEHRPAVELAIVLLMRSEREQM